MMELATFGELQRNGVEAAVAYFKAIFQYSLGGNVENHKTAIRKTDVTGWDSNRTSPE
jgi:hypothetical protein